MNKTEFHINTARDNKSLGNMSRAVFAMVSLGMFNLIFVLGPFVGFLGVLVGLYAVVLVLLVTPFAVVFALGIPGGLQEFFMQIFILMALVGLGVCMAVAMMYVTRWTYLLFIKYLQFNVKIVKGGK